MVKKLVLVPKQQAPNNAIKSINTINNYITHLGQCQEFFSERSELILREGDNKP